MTTLARSLLRDADDAADAVEQALIKVRDAAPGFRGARGLRTWVLRITANLCRDQLRRKKFVAGRVEDLDPIADARLSVHPVEDWDRDLDQQKVLAALERAIDELPREQREAVILRDRLGLSYAEVAETLGISEGGVKSRLFRARETLKKRLRPFWDE
jgi:RNA polymerase sigma-70 factor (ECF subfamily)